MEEFSKALAENKYVDAAKHLERVRATETSNSKLFKSNLGDGRIPEVSLPLSGDW